MTTLKVLLFSSIVTVHLVLLSSALRRHGGIVRYDAESEDDVFTSAVLDEKTGALYVSAGVSAVRRFTSSLVLDAKYPLTSSSACGGDHPTNCRSCPGGNVSTATDRVANSTGTGIVRLDSASGLLLACAGRCGLCSVLNTTDDAGRRPRMLDPSSSASYLASGVVGASAVMVFAGENATVVAANGTAPVPKLFVAGATAFGLEAVSIREKEPATDDFRTIGARQFSSEAGGDLYRFVDALDAGDGFVYFVAVREAAAETRLVRVCRDDTGRLDSYVELKLSCLPQTAPTDPLDVAVTARIGSVGADLAWRFQWVAGEPAIYLVAERRQPANQEAGSGRRTSGICVYPMRQVRNGMARS